MNRSNPLTLVRLIHSSRATIYKALVTPELLHRWLAPHTHSVKSATLDIVPGGTYCFETEDSEGNKHVITGEYLELVPNTRVVKSYICADANQAHGIAATLLSFELREIKADITELTFVHSKLPDSLAYDLYLNTWTSCLDRLHDCCTDKPTVQ